MKVGLFSDETNQVVLQNNKMVSKQRFVCALWFVFVWLLLTLLWVNWAYC